MSSLNRFIVVTLIIVSVLLISGQVFAETYTSNVSFHSTFYGTSRTYNGNQISISMSDVYLTGAAPGVIKRYYTVKCLKDGFWIFDTELPGSLKSVAYAEESGYLPVSASKTWTMAGSGSYIFLFINDYVYGNECIRSDYVVMSSN
ncbi:MAG TPA: hypothetical protein DCM45_05255 [Clostridiales bacterium]|nr:hypothetical protein [Clostridiales bacterium]